MICWVRDWVGGSYKGLGTELMGDLDPEGLEHWTDRQMGQNTENEQVLKAEAYLLSLPLPQHFQWPHPETWHLHQ